jgi:RecJ-like exonuclease
MLQDFNNKGRFCPDCGVDVSAICPVCHGLGYIQPLPSFPTFTVAICNHADERGEYCSQCGAKLQTQPMSVTCTRCSGKGWVPAAYHYCLKKLNPPPRR